MASLSDTFHRWASTPYVGGRGLHSDIFAVVIGLLEKGHSEDVVFSFVRRAADQVEERVVPDREILSAIEYAKLRMGDPERKASNRWPTFDPAYRSEVVSTGGFSLESFANVVEMHPQETRYWLGRIYSPGDLVCLGWSGTSFTTVALEEATHLCDRNVFEYLNPSPMRSREGTTKDGKASQHCLDNCGPRVWQVIEFDTGGPHEHSAILWHLAHRLPLKMVVYSGGKSMHGWFDTKRSDEESVKEFFAEAVMLGADPKMWSTCQFSRIPGGTNSKTGRRQEVVLFEE